MAFKKHEAEPEEIEQTAPSTDEDQPEAGEGISLVKQPEDQEDQPEGQTIVSPPLPDYTAQMQEITGAIKTLTAQVTELKKAAAAQQIPGQDNSERFDELLEAVHGIPKPAPIYQNNMPGKQATPAPPKGLFDKIITFAFWAVFGLDVLVLIPWLAYSHFAGDTYNRLETIRYDIIHPGGDAYMPDGQTIYARNGMIYQVQPNPDPKNWGKTQKVQNEIDYMREQDRRKAQPAQ